MSDPTPRERLGSNSITPIMLIDRSLYDDWASKLATDVRKMLSEFELAASREKKVALWPSLRIEAYSAGPAAFMPSLGLRGEVLCEARAGRSKAQVLDDYLAELALGHAS